MLIGADIELVCPKRPFERVDCAVYIETGACRFRSKKECVQYHMGSLRVVAEPAVDHEEGKA